MDGNGQGFTIPVPSRGPRDRGANGSSPNLLKFKLYCVYGEKGNQNIPGKKRKTVFPGGRKREISGR